MSYKHQVIDQKWQAQWAKDHAFKAEIIENKPKYYVLGMFPYPSGAGLHVGHLASYTPPDIVARYKRARGFNVLNPMGFDAFGLPAEQYAIQTGVHPQKTTEAAIENFRRQMKSFGFSFDWDREVSTSDPDYYKWTQALFLKLFEGGLAYKKEMPVNWCPALKTILANEEVVDGKSERGGHPVERIPMRQWVLKITDYAEKLLSGLDQIQWPERTKDGQRNWIGKSEGAEVVFQIAGSKENITVFTTRPDTLFGATFMVLAPEHRLVEKITTSAQKAAVEKYIKKTSTKSELERKSSVEKTGEFTGAYGMNPVSGEKIPIWISDYILMDYGTGAIMAVPGHDTRDFEFAQKLNLPIKRVIESADELPYEGEGKLVNSDFLNGKSKTEAIEAMILNLEKKSLGHRRVQYKLRDWLFSRQRYWGEPFPIYYKSEEKEEGSAPLGVPLADLPVKLPQVPDYEPTQDGLSPLARVHDWVKFKKDGQNLYRDTNTMPGSAGSSWYFLRYTDPQNSQEAYSRKAEKYWMPVDLYVGGPEHTVGHLLYSRFWHRFLYDQGLVTHEEPFAKLAHQGMILGADGEKMSKSRGNTINPDEVRENFGADATRMYICFMGPLDKDKPWATTGIEGVRRFLDRVWRLVCNDDGETVAADISLPPEAEKLLHKTIKKVTEDIENMSFNTSVSAMMILVNEFYKLEIKPKNATKILAQLMMPFAPHLAEEIWQKLGGKGLVSLAPWPEYDPKLIIEDVVTLGVQVNGKLRGAISLAPDAEEAVAVSLAMAIDGVTKALGGKKADKVIYKAGRILNLIVKGT